MARSNRKLTPEEKEFLTQIKPIYRYTRDQLLQINNLYNEFVDNVQLCFTCNQNELQKTKNGLLAWFELYKDNEAKVRMEEEHRLATEKAQSKLNELNKNDKLSKAKSDVKKYILAKDKNKEE